MRFNGPSSSPSRAELLLAAATVAAGLLLAPWRVVDPDTLARLAVGREIVAARGVPAADPFTFSAPAPYFSNPEWLADVVLYAAHSVGGESGVVAFSLALVALALVLVLRLCARMGAAAPVAAGLLLLLAPGLAAGLAARNYLHAYWLVPLYGLVLAGARARPRRALWLVPLGVLWASLHASFPLGWIVILAHLVQVLVDGGTPRRHLTLLAALLAAHPLLGLISPHGIHNYDQILDHLRGAPIYRELILEWRAADLHPVPAAVGQLPLHLLALVGLSSFLARPNRRQAGPLLLLLAGLALGYASRRFLPLAVLLGLPAVAANVTRLAEAARPAVRRVGAALLLLIGAGLVVPVVWHARAHPRRPVLERTDAPLDAARFLARSVPGEVRLFNPYNAGPWLLWLSGPRVRLFIDPRNNLGATALERYVSRLLPHPALFEEAARTQRVSHSLVDLTDGRMSTLGRHLDDAATWSLVYLDGRFALFQRRPRDAGSFRWLRARTDFGYLRPLPAAALVEDRARLRAQSPALEQALAGYLLLCRAGAPPPALGPSSAAARSDAAEARRLLEGALPRLPPSPALMAYLATALVRLDERRAARQVMDQARALFPTAPLLLELHGTLRARDR